MGIEKIKNNEIIQNKWTKEELKELKEEIIFHENENSDEWGNEHLDPLDEKLKNIIPISEIGAFDNEWHFNLKEDIKWEDEIGSYILVRGQKYYDDITRSNIEEFEWQWYNIIHHADGSESVELWKMNNMSLESGTKYFKDKILNWKRDLDWHMKWIVKLSDSDGSIRIFDWEFEYGLPKNCTLKKFENWKLKYTYKWTFNPTRQSNWEWIVYSYRSPDWEWTMRWPDENNYTGMYTWEFKNGKMEWKWKYEFNSWAIYEWEWKNNNREWQWTMTYKGGSIYKWEWKNWKKNWKCEYYKLRNGDTYKYVQWENDKAKASEWELNYANWDTYVWCFLVDRNWMHVPFFKIEEEERPDNILEELWKDQIISTWKESNGRIHIFTITKWSISEEWNGFITMYGDKKPNEHRDDERKNVMYHKRETSHTKEYDLTTWDYQINREFDWANYKFYYKKNEINNKRLPYNKWKVFSLPSSIWEKGAMHVANIMNKLIYEYKNHNREYGFGAGNEWDLLWQNYAPDGVLLPPSAWGTVNSYSIKPYRNPKLGYPKQLSKTQINSSFWWETTDKIATWLNSVVCE